MAELGSISPGVANTGTPDGVTAFVSLPDNAWETIDSADDGDYAYVDTNTTDNYAVGYVLGNMPTDFGNMDSGTCNVRVRYAWDAKSTGNEIWNDIDARVVTATGTVLAAADSGGTFETVVDVPGSAEGDGILTTTATNTTNISFTYVNTGASKSQWDNAVLEVRINRVKNKGGGTDQQRIYAAEINGTYTISSGPAYQVYLIT